MPEDCLIPALISEIEPETEEIGEGKKYEEGARGLHGYYFKGMEFEELVLERLDPVINFNWESGTPDEKVPVDKFSIRWTGWLEPKESGRHRFCGYTDDGFRLWVGGKMIGEFWQDRPPRTTFCETELEAGKRHSIRMDWYENGGGTAASLYWLYGEKLKEQEKAEKAKLEEAEKKDKETGKEAKDG